MRKILLATAAGFAAFVADGVAPARAQAGTDVTGQGTPTPGITARFSGRYRMYMGYVVQSPNSSQGNIPAAAGTNNAGTAVALVPLTPFQNEYNNFDFMDYARLFPGFDGVAANGLRYGASLEIRMGSGANARGDSRSTLFYRRIWGYVGTPTLGQIRVGSGPTGAVETMHVGHITGFGSGGWDGDAPGFIMGANASNTFWYSASGRNNYTKIGYFSPQFFGFDFGLSYGPNDGNFGGDSACTAANFASGTDSSNCDRLSKTSNPAGLLRAQNIYEIMARYRGTFGPVGVAISGGYVGSGTVDNISGNPGGFSPKNLSVGLGGATVSWAGLTVGGIISGGTANLGTQGLALAGTNPRQVGTNDIRAFAPGSLTPRLDVPGGDNSNLFTWELGAQYTFGPFIVGGHYFNAEYAGNQRADTGKRKAQGVAVGGTWNIAPGLALFLEFLWGEVKESNVNLVTGLAGASNNEVNVYLTSLGISFAW